jgi:Tfp pilus assembly protein PilO
VKSNTKSSVLLALAVLAAAFFLVIKPKMDEVDAANATLENSTQVLRTTRIELASAGPKADDPELIRLVEKVPRTADTPAFLDQINLIGAQFGVSISELTFSQPSPASVGIGSEVKVSLTAGGPRASIDQFLTSISQLPRLAIVDQSTLNADAATGEALPSLSGNVTANLQIVLFTGVTVTPG